MQPADIFLLPNSWRQYFSAIKIKQEQPVILINLNVVGVEVSMINAGGVKLMQVRTKVLPELNVTWRLRDSFCQGPDSRRTNRQEVGCVYRSGTTIAGRRRLGNR